MLQGDRSRHVSSKPSNGSRQSRPARDGVAFPEHHDDRQDQHRSDDVRPHHDGQLRVDGPQAQVQQSQERFVIVKPEL